MGKTVLKKCGIAFMSASRYVVNSEQLQDWLTCHVCPYLLDQNVLANDYVPRPIHGMSTTWLCNPYQFPHYRPYWFGRLESIPLDNYMRRYLSIGDTFIDIGANCGQYTVMASTLVGSKGRVISFEPATHMFRLLSKHLQRSNLKNVSLLNVALGDYVAECALQFNRLAPGSSSIRHVEGDMGSFEPEECQMLTGDSCLLNETFSGSTRAKIDVEGFELAVIRGMLSTIRSHIRSVIVEITPWWIGGRDGIDEMWSLFKTSGFESRYIERDGSCRRLCNASDIAIDRQTDVVFERIQ
jgi:FkbM family methyltransferase